MAEKIGRLVEQVGEHRHAVYHSFTSIALHFIVAFGVTLALTGQAIMSGAVAVIEPVVCHFAHQVHDWVWRLFGDKNVGHKDVDALNMQTDTVAAIA